GNSAAGASDAQAGSKTSDEAITMRLATSVQKDHPMNLAALEFARLVNEKSNGRIKVDVYSSRQLGQDNEVAEMVMQGSLDMVEISSIMFSNYTKLTNAWQIPFLFSDMEQYRKTIKSEANKALLDGITELNLGIKALAIYNTGFRHIVVNGKDVNSIDGMKNLKIRTAESDLFLDMFKALGSAPTPMAYGEVYSGLQNKVIDSCEADFSAIYLEKFFEVSNSMTELKHFMWPGLLAINKARFDSFSPEDQQIILEAAEEAVDYNVDNIIECEDHYRNLLTEAGFKINTLSEEEVKRFNDAVAPVVEKYSNLDKRIADFVAEAKANK
ncbi:MAG TPA: hypothetical protein DHV55_02375, partial [Clostridiaceae bacterium]|nr:hypothetical protein [Clostridiaceae bacterium]